MSPHVLVADDVDDRTGDFAAVQVDALQQRLQPAHVAFDVRVEEGENLT